MDEGERVYFKTDNHRVLKKGLEIKGWKELRARPETTKYGMDKTLKLPELLDTDNAQRKKHCKYSSQEKECSGCNQVSVAGQACDRGPAVPHPSPPHPALSEPWVTGMNQL